MPKHLKAVLLAIAVFVAIMPATAFAIPSMNFYEQDGGVYDDWNVCRTSCAGEDGFFQVSETSFCPIILGESLGGNAGRAYELGQQFAQEYPDFNQRAEKIFAYARDRVRYTPDKDTFGHREFAQNADELAVAIDDEGIARGDCEDYAILLAAMYKGAGFRSAIVLAPAHAAALVYLPGYKRANRILFFKGEEGWVWAEATGGNNPLGWMPESHMGVELVIYEVENVAITGMDAGDMTPIVVPGRGSAGFNMSPFFGVMAMMWILSMFRRRRR